MTELVRGLEPHADFAAAEATDFLRADPEWDGGITGAIKIARVAEGLGLDVEYHLPGPAHRHLMAATRNSNYYELGLVGPSSGPPHAEPPVYEDYTDRLEAIEERLKRRLSRVEAALYAEANPDGVDGTAPLYRILDRAREVAARVGTGDRVEFVESDLFRFDTECEAVELAKQRVRRGAGGLANGVLRAIDRQRELAHLDPPPGEVVTTLAIGEEGVTVRVDLTEDPPLYTLLEPDEAALSDDQRDLWNGFLDPESDAFRGENGLLAPLDLRAVVGETARFEREEEALLVYSFDPAAMPGGAATYPTRNAGAPLSIARSPASKKVTSWPAASSVSRPASAIGSVTSTFILGRRPPLALNVFAYA